MTAACPHRVAAPGFTGASPSRRRRVGAVIENGPWRRRDDAVRVPGEPGLGVALDARPARRWPAHFAWHGPLGHFGDPARCRRLSLQARARPPSRASHHRVRPT